MIDINDWIDRLGEEDDTEIKDNEKYQHELFMKYVLRKNDKFHAKRAELARQYRQDPDYLVRGDCAGSWQRLTCPILAGHICSTSSKGNHRHSMRSWMIRGARVS